MRIVMATLVVSGMLLGHIPGASGQTPGKGIVQEVEVRATITAIDKEKGTLTLKGPKRTVKLEVQDRSKLDEVKVGDPVLATYIEAMALQVKKAGTAAPGITTQETRVTSKPGENPAGAIGQEVTVTGTITAIDRKANTVTIKGPQGGTETVTAQDPKNLEGIKVGDLVELTFTRALALKLDKPAK